MEQALVGNRDHNWFDVPYTQAEIEAAAARLHAGRAAQLETRGVPLSTEEAHREIDRDRWAYMLRTWLRGVAAWGGDSRDLAIAYGKRAKAAGLLD